MSGPHLRKCHFRLAVQKLRKERSVDAVLRLNEIRKMPVLARDRAYQRCFTRYYAMGQKSGFFYQAFFSILQRTASELSAPSLKRVLRYLFKRTGQRHLSFSSKLLATVDDSAVVYDRIVAKYLGVPSSSLASKKDWLGEAVRRYEEIRNRIEDFVRRPDWPKGQALFDKTFPKGAHLPVLRKADLLIWASERALIDKAVALRHGSARVRYSGHFGGHLAKKP